MAVACAFMWRPRGVHTAHLRRPQHDAGALEEEDLDERLHMAVTYGGYIWRLHAARRGSARGGRPGWGSRAAGQQGSREAWTQGSRPGRGRRRCGGTGSRAAGQQGSRAAGQQGSRAVGQQVSRAAGQLAWMEQAAMRYDGSKWSEHQRPKREELALCTVRALPNASSRVADSSAASVHCAGDGGGRGGCERHAKGAHGAGRFHAEALQRP